MFFSSWVEIFVHVVVKLWPIASYNRLGYSGPANDAPPHKLNDIFVLDGGEGFNFYPFTKIVGGNQ